MSEKVTITLSVQDAEALAAWRRENAQIGLVQESLRNTKREAAATIAEEKRLSEAFLATFKSAETAQSHFAAGLSEVAKKQAAAQSQFAGTFKGKLTKAYDAATKAFGKHVGAVNSGNETLAGFAKNRLAEWASYATAVGVATKAVRELIEANKKVRGEEADVTFTLDQHFRGLQVQGRMTDAEGAAAREEVFDIAERQAAKVEMVAGIAKQLISSGFDRDLVIKGGAAEELTKGVQASAMQGQETENPKEFTEAITQFLLAQTGKEKGEKLTAEEQGAALSLENLSAAVRETQGLFLKRNIQFADLGELAKAAPALSRAGLDMTTQLAAFTKMRDVLGAEEASTSLRNIALRMQTSGASKEKTGALAEIGLTPEDVDMEGESFEEALSRLRDALATHGPAKQAEVLKKIFEERGGLGASVLIQNVEDIAKYRTEAKDTSAFDASLKTATSGFAAAKNREETQKQRQRFGGQGAEDALIAEAIENEYSAAGSPVRGSVVRKEFEALRGVGMDWGKALSAVIGDQKQIDRVLNRVAQARQGSRALDMSAVDTDTWRATPFKMPLPTEQDAAGSGATANDVASRQARQAEYARRAKANQEAAEQAAQAKLDKKQQAEKKRADAAQETLLKKADAAGKEADRLGEEIVRDAAQVKELQTELRAKKAINAASETRTKVANPWGGSPTRKRGKAPREKSEAEKLREAESIRRLEQRIEEAQQKQREHEAEAQKKLDEHTKLLEQIAANTANPNVTIKNPGDPARNNRAASPPPSPIRAP